MVDFFLNNGIMIDEIIYSLCGLVAISTAFRGLKNKKSPYGTFAFWFILGLMFIFGGWLTRSFEWGKTLMGAALFVLGILTLTKQVQFGEFTPATEEVRQENAKKIGLWVFVPALVLAFSAMFLSMIKIPYTVVEEGVEVAKNFTFSGAFSVGIASLLALLVGWIIARPKASQINEDSTRLLMQVGAASLLPQLLGALGTLFNEAGVGDVVSNLISGFVPEGNIVMGVIVYCLGMVIFTMIMGNAFAAFAVITVGIGIPFVIAQGGNPAVVGALGMTCGFCGTLMTPMAANFNIVPTAVLETKDNMTVIKSQVPLALTMIVVHIILMLVLAF